MYNLIADHAITPMAIERKLEFDKRGECNRMVRIIIGKPFGDKQE